MLTPHEAATLGAWMIGASFAMTFAFSAAVFVKHYRDELNDEKRAEL